MSEVSMSGRLPKGDADGLGAIARDLIQEPEKVHAVLILVDCKKVITETDTGETVPVMRIRRAEPIRKEDLGDAQRLIRRAWEARSGDTVLPMELEDDITAIFKGVDFEHAPEQPTDSKPKPDNRGGSDLGDDPDGDIAGYDGPR